ncbi:MAG: hypothetical protein ACI30R_00905 [Sodaliphilus sp.]
MENKNHYLSPKEMIEVYKTLESGLPSRPFSIYQPSMIAPINGAYTESQLIQEAVRMMEFMGLNGYGAEVKYEEMEGNAGYILFPDRISEKMAHIRVSTKFKTSWVSMVAILAHEICHKLLPVYGLNTNDEEMVDLCTIYVGFGDVVLHGYFNNSFGEDVQQMGYLAPENYKVAAQLVNVVRGRMSLDEAGYEDEDVLMTDTLKIWLSYGGEREALKELFRLYEQQKAEVLRNVNLLEQCLSDIKMSQKVDFQRFNRRFGSFLRGKEGNNAMHVVDLLYQKYLQNSESDSDLEPVINPQLDAINSAINSLLFELNKVKNFDFNYKVVCPECGQTSSPINHDKLLKCPNPSCGFYFFHKGEPWNATVHHRRANQKRLEEAAERNELIAKRVNEETRKANQRVDDTLTDARQRIAYAQQKAKKEVEDIRQNEINRYRETVKRRTPALLRWLLKKYL